MWLAITSQSKSYIPHDKPLATDCLADKISRLSTTITVTGGVVIIKFGDRNPEKGEKRKPVPGHTKGSRKLKLHSKVHLP